MTEEEHDVGQALGEAIETILPDHMSETALMASLATVAEYYAHCPHCAARALIETGLSMLEYAMTLEEADSAIKH